MGFAGQLTGNIEKAIIEIVDMRNVIPDDDTIENQAEAAKNAATTYMSTLKGSGGLTSLTNPEVLANAAGALSGNASQNIEGATVKQFRVQFNPSEVTIGGYGGGLMQKVDYTAPNGSGISMGAMDCRITFGVRLIFDQVENDDAFMASKINLAPSSLGTKAVKGIKKVAGYKKKGPTVQNEVEGLIAALRNERTRVITFAWAKMLYTGTLLSVNSNYTMFNINGQPIRGEVNLTIVLQDADVTKNNMGVWQQKYKDAFKKERRIFDDQAIDYSANNQAMANFLNW